MPAVIGLGNPGEEYRYTRHNVGFRVIEALSGSLNVRLRGGPGEYLIGTSGTGDRAIHLVQPMTFMNNSGLAVLDVMREYGCPADDLIIVLDDFHLPLGTLRLRTGGSDGGHNGLASVIYQLQTDMVPRLRCGIATDGMPAGSEGLSSFVLSPFPESDRTIVEQMITAARDAVLTAVREGFEAAMSRFNASQT